MGTETAAPSTNPTPDEAAGTVPATSLGSADGTPTVTDVSTLGGTLLSEAPAVQPHAVEQARADALAQKDLDCNGDAFNPAIHAQNADGSPRKTAGGAWAKKRGRGAQKGATPTGPAKVNIPGGAGTQATAPGTLSKEQLARRGGAGAANLLLMLGVGLGGEEWQPRKDEKIGLDEKAMLEEVFGDYFVATGKTDLPPGWALVAGIGMYALPRFAMPKTRTRLQRAKDWIGAKVVQWRARRAGLKVRVSTASEADLVKEEMRQRDELRAATGRA